MMLRLVSILLVLFTAWACSLEGPSRISPFSSRHLEAGGPFEVLEASFSSPNALSDHVLEWPRFSLRLGPKETAFEQIYETMVFEMSYHYWRGPGDDPATGELYTIRNHFVVALSGDPDALSLWALPNDQNHNFLVEEASSARLNADGTLDVLLVFDPQHILSTWALEGKAYWIESFHIQGLAREGLVALWNLLSFYPDEASFSSCQHNSGIRFVYDAQKQNYSFVTSASPHCVLSQGGL